MIILHQTFDPLFIDYCTYFNGNKDYFECHEVLEELWKDVAPRDKEHVLVGFIQVATSLYHWRRGNVRGAEKSLASAIELLRQHLECSYFDVVDANDLLANCETALSSIRAGNGYESFELVFVDEAFRKLVAERISLLPAVDPHFITHKHTLRDRSDVILERAASLAARRL